ncbi:hypothetical protein M011DRAFT_49891 [Sporormia fimetaria CBS 119925]|uniref:Uncharacterized protein n=1 Tax=Sporormia fimetaria CBS 119925 TaxID=1340428 RepID=A0A6A6VD44_9PLEO|nr:hypothetical protein M011DRAFT_49891 [Sporormia fimetaria CBS 119925]
MSPQNDQQNHLLALPQELRDIIYAHLYHTPITIPSGQILSSPPLLDIAEHAVSPLGVPLPPPRPANDSRTSDTPMSASRSTPEVEQQSKKFPLPIPPSMLSPLTKTCKQMYKETASWSLSSCLLYISDTRSAAFLTGCLDYLGPDAWRMVRHLEFADFPRIEQLPFHQEPGNVYNANPSTSEEFRLLRSCTRVQNVSLTLWHVAIGEFAGWEFASPGGALKPESDLSDLEVAERVLGRRWWKLVTAWGGWMYNSDIVLGRLRAAKCVAWWGLNGLLETGCWRSWRSIVVRCFYTDGERGRKENGRNRKRCLVYELSGRVTEAGLREWFVDELGQRGWEGEVECEFAGDGGWDHWGPEDERLWVMGGGWRGMVRWFEEGVWPWKDESGRNLRE